MRIVRPAAGTNVPHSNEIPIVLTRVYRPGEEPFVFVAEMRMRWERVASKFGERFENLDGPAGLDGSGSDGEE